MSTRKGRIISLLTILAISIGLIGGIIAMQFKELTKSSAAAKTIGNYSFYEMSAETPIDYTDCFTYTTTATEATITGLTAKGKTMERLETPLTFNSLPITTIGENAIRSTVLKTLIVNNGVTTIQSMAFAFNANLTSIRIPDTVTTVSSTASQSLFSNTYIIEADIPAMIVGVITNNATRDRLQVLRINSGEVLSTYRLYAKKTLKKLTIAGNVTISQIAMFNGYSALEEVSIEEGFTTLPSQTFNNCAALYSITLPDTLSNIGPWAFAYSTGILRIIIPASVEIIQSRAFEYWTAAQTIYCRSVQQPEGWSGNWSANCNANIVWGYTGN